MAHFATLVALIGIVIIVASLLSGLLERIRLPVVAVFLGLGVLLGPWGLGLVDIGFGSPELHALATLALALVLFSDAVTLDLREIRSRRGLLLRILGPGTLLPAALVAVAAKFLLDVPAPAAAILGAALASTDPVLLRTVLRSPALPETPRIALRMEGGMNDIVLLPIVIISMLFLRGAAPAGTGDAANGTLVRSILGLFLLGPAVGVFVGWVGISALGWVRKRVSVRRDYESLYALGLAFTAFAAAEGVGGSGFVAAFAAGLLVDAQDTELCDCFLEYGEATAEMLLLLTFVALGTTLIWTGLGVIDTRTLLFAAIALGARTVVLYPVVRGAGLSPRDRRLIALLGPRGLSSLLLVLLPVFAGVPGAERLFSITCLVVLISVVIHGGGIALLLRSNGGTVPVPPAPAPPASEDVPERITLEELEALQGRAEPVVIVDARTDRSYGADPRLALGAVRVRPEDPVRDATALRLSRQATIAVYCA
jgi:NhaP-type Na+/H+ or K+/H+ antiporter